MLIWILCMPFYSNIQTEIINRIKTDALKKPLNIHNQDDLNFALSINQNDNSFWVKKKLNFNKNIIYVYL